MGPYRTSGRIDLKITYELTEDELRAAIKSFVEKKYGVQMVDDPAVWFKTGDSVLQRWTDYKPKYATVCIRDYK